MLASGDIIKQTQAKLIISNRSIENLSIRHIDELFYAFNIDLLEWEC